ncbi:MAG: GerAB/ArcD/ProY family transporter [Clostridia bacterium]|nr:GerAB/ArcD/ProY family transporter [Clostridia bacterium]
MVMNNVTPPSDENNKISTWGYSSFMVTLTKSGFLGMASYIMFSYSSINTYLSAILGTMIGILPLLIFIFIIKHSENKDIIDLNITILGKFFGNILNTILNITVLFMSVLALYNISQFVDIQYMPDTDTNYLRILILIPIVYAASKDISVISKISQIIFCINLTIFILTILGCIDACDVDNIFPFMKDGISPVIKSTLIYVIFTTFPMFLLTIIPQSSIVQEKSKIQKIFFMYMLGNLMLIFIIMITVFILGEDLIPMFRYPEYIALKRFKLFEIIERVENTLSLQFVFNSIMYLIVSFHFIIQSLKKILKSKKIENLFPYVLAAIILVLSNIFFKNTVKSTEFIKQYIPYIISIGLFIPMFITFIILIIKNIKAKC